MGNTLSTNGFIVRAMNSHGNLYDYSLVDYVNSHTKINITCPKHGIFTQRPYSHLNGSGCPKCKAEYIGDISRGDVSTFINNANNIHDEKYDYTKVKYVNSKTKVIITCPIHGEFKQTPSHHLNGRRCPKCSGRYKHTTAEWIKIAKKLNGQLYDYSKVIYENNKTKVCIICPEHGEFWQTPSNHIHGAQKCPVCTILSKGESKIYKILTDLNINFTSEKTFIECKDLRKLPFDFYIPSKSLLIEYDGIQHFKPRIHFGGLKGYLRIKKHDKIKQEFANNNNITLLRIAYTEISTLTAIIYNALKVHKSDQQLSES